jgi:hypothetical protein
MKPPLKPHEVSWLRPISIEWSVSGLSLEEATAVLQMRIRDEWPEGAGYPEQTVYVVRLDGDVAVRYERRWSPVIYIGEGNGRQRLLNHARWLASILQAVPDTHVLIHVAECKRKALRDRNLCEYVEADLIAWFKKDHGELPWLNQQNEHKANEYQYTPEALKECRDRIGVGAGKVFRWALEPTKNHEFFAQFSKKG